MNLADIITLAKAGYKPNEVKELMALAQPEPTEPPKQDPPAPEPPKQDPPAPQPDDKSQELAKKLQDLEAELQKTKDDLKAAQQANINRNIDDDKTDKRTDLQKMQDLFR